MYKLKFLIISLLLFSVSGCMTTSPEDRLKEAQIRAEASKSNYEFAQREFAPLIKVCLSVLESGNLQDAMTLESIQYKKSKDIFGSTVFTKKIGEATFSNGFSKNFIKLFLTEKDCNIGHDFIGGLNEGGRYLREQLEANGFKFESRKKGDHIFASEKFKIEYKGTSSRYNSIFLTNYSFKKI